MKNNILFLALLTICSNCSNHNANAQSKLEIFERHKTEWIAYLKESKQVGNPCDIDMDFEKWSSENPNFTYGLQPIQNAVGDYNQDGSNDILYYFEGINCLGGNAYCSDFSTLICTNGSEMSYNHDFSKVVDSSMLTELNKNLKERLPNGNYEAYKIIFHFEKTYSGHLIIGNFSAWVNDDANCCPSIEGTFNLNPLTLDVILDFPLG